MNRRLHFLRIFCLFALVLCFVTFLPSRTFAEENSDIDAAENSEEVIADPESPDDQPATSPEENQKNNSAAPKSISLSLRPSNQDIELSPGKSYTGNITVFNPSDYGVELEVSVSPFQVSGDDYLPDYTILNSYTSMKNWITVHETELSIPAHNSFELGFTVDVPESVPGGGQYAAIIIRSKQPESSGGDVSVVPQVAAILNGHVSGGETQYAGEMTEHHLPFLMIGDFKITSVFRNSGNIDYRVWQSLEVRDFFTNQLLFSPESKNEVDELAGVLNAIVLPDTSRTLTLSWDDAPEIGLFKVKQTITYLEESQTFEKVVFLCPVWLLVCIIIMITMLVLWIALEIIKHRRKNAQVY